MKATKWRINVDGIEELAKAFRYAAEEAQDVIDEATKAGAEIVLKEAKENVPVDSGALRDSLEIKKEKSRKKGKQYYQVRSKGTSQGGVRYGFAVEFGTQKMEAQPFLRPALEDNKNEIKDEINKVISEALERGFK